LQTFDGQWIVKEKMWGPSVEYLDDETRGVAAAPRASPSGDDPAALPLEALRVVSHGDTELIEQALAGAAHVTAGEHAGRFNAYRAIAAFDRTGSIPAAARTAEDALLEIDELCSGAFRFDVARDVAIAYATRFPESSDLARDRAHLDGPGSGRSGTWHSDAECDVDVVSQPGAKTTVVLFRGLGGKIGFPANVLWHLWLSAYPVNMIVVRDHHNVVYLSGIASLGSLSESVAALVEMSRSLGAARIVTMGNSAGAAGAMLYGTLMGAERCLAFAPPLRFPRKVIVGKHETARARLLAWREEGRIQWPDARTTLEGSAMRAEIFYGADIKKDVYHAEAVAGLPNVRLHAVSDVKTHPRVMKALMEQGLFKPVLDDAFGPPLAGRDACGAAPHAKTA
jgi:hypothetical protein